VKVAIVGGGITGLACAHYLRAAGVHAVVFDPAPGGLIGTINVEGCQLEIGPESWLASKPWAEELIRELGLGADLVGSSDAKRRTYVRRGGKFVPLPEGLQLVVPTKLRPTLESELFSWNTKARMAAEVFRSPTALPDRSVAAFVAGHFGQEAVDYLAEPLLAGVYGGSPEELSAPSVLPKFVEYEQRFGSVVVGALREKRKAAAQPVFKSLRRGMGSLIDALREGTEIVSAAVHGVGLAGAGWGVFVDAEWQEFDRIVLCCGANASAVLMAGVDPEVSRLLASIPYTGSSIWTLGYRRADIHHPLDAFGFLIPRKERNAIMACTWVATKWSNRVPEDKAVLRCFSTDPEVTLPAVRADLERLMGVNAEPLFSLNHKWPNSMPQYTVGHTARIAELEERVAALPGLHLAGNAYHGVGIPDCVRSARRAAERILRGG
jgi:oxygen-dependent protoporphyrinogen oxidase